MILNSIEYVTDDDYRAKQHDYDSRYRLRCTVVVSVDGQYVRYVALTNNGRRDDHTKRRLYTTLQDYLDRQEMMRNE